MTSLNRAKVLITGGSSGIGRALARKLAVMGCDLFLVARRQGLLDDTLAELGNLRVRDSQIFAAHPADVSDDKQVGTAVSAALEEIGPPEVLINSAGIAHPGYFLDLPPEAFRRLIEVNYLGTVYMCRAVAPYMVERGSGHIVNISSGAGYLAIIGYSAYSASKFAVRGFTEALRHELRPLGIRVSIVYPPDVDTPQYRKDDEARPYETRQIASMAKLMSADRAAEIIIRGIRRNRIQIVPGFENRLFFTLLNPLSRLAFTILDIMLKDARKKSR